MSERFTRFIEDLQIFAADLRLFLNPKTTSDGLMDYWGNICDNKERRTALIFTAAVHLGALFFAIFGPKIISFKPTIPEIYTVDLYRVIEQQPEVVKLPPKVPKIEIKQKPVVKPIKKTQPPPIARPKAISLSPLKKRLAREKDERDREKRQQDLFKSLVNQVKLDFKKEQAERDAKEAASNAVSKISDLYRKEKKQSTIKSLFNQTNIPSTATSNFQNSPREMEAIEKYKARLVQHIDRFWKLPELKKWSDNLECEMVIKVNRNGWVLSHYIKKRSSDHRFNQYVLKAFESSIPFPPFPPELPRQEDEIHVTFYPGGLL